MEFPLMCLPCHRIGFIASLIRVFLSAIFIVGCSSADRTALPAGETLNTGRDISLGGTTTPLGQFPTGLVPTADGKYAIACGMGYREALFSVATADGHVAGEVDFATKPPTHIQPQNGVEDNRSDDPQIKSNGVYVGVAVSGDTVYAAQGAHDSIAVLKLGSDGSLTKTGSIKTRTDDFPAGLAVDGKGLLYVANNAAASSDAATFNLPASVAIFDPTTGSERGRFVFDSPTHTSNFMLAITVLRNGSKIRRSPNSAAAQPRSEPVVCRQCAQ
jgi:DNA-binding beta-propeller fold protein YncE